MDVQDAVFLQEAEDETLAASSSSSSSSDQGWQKVTYPKRQRKAAPAKPAPSDPRADPRPAGPSSSYVFASVEQKAQERRRALESAALAAAAAAAAEGAAPARSKPAARRAFDSDEDDSSEAEGAAGKEEGAAEGEKKVKQKKPKKPKVTLVEAASKIDAEDLASFLVEIGQSYEAQPDIQLMRFADYFARSFAAVAASQFPWAKMFKDYPIAKIVDVPLCHISESVYKTSVDWIGQRPTEALGTFVLWSLDSILNDLNRQQATSKGSKKIVQQSSTKSQ
ncbi:hypothetical protein Taro_039279, partial [Colocasia esculenta]|nr:hypothetical protein [Colocasia esculenta]